MKTFIIDDDNISIYLTKHYLKVSGFPGEISSFLSAEEALSVLLPDIATAVSQIIFLDLNMPGMNGWEFLEALAPYKEQLLDRCRIYILTSSLALADTAKSEEYKLVRGFIHKPLDQADIQVIISQLAE